MSDYRNIVENIVRSYGVPEWTEDYDISCEGYIDGVIDWLMAWDWEEHFGVPEGVRNFINTHKEKDFGETIIHQCYQIVLTTLAEHYLRTDEETVKRDRKGKTDAGYICDVLTEIADRQVWYCAWSERVVRDGWKDDFGEWTPVGMFMWKYLKKAYQTAKRGTPKWEELEEAGLVKSLLGYGVY